MAFKGTCVLLGPVKGKVAVGKAIKAGGGDTTTAMDDDVTHVVSTAAEVAKQTAMITWALGEGIPIVAESWLDDCKKAKKPVDTFKHLLNAAGGGAAAAPAAVVAPTAKLSKAAQKALAKQGLPTTTAPASPPPAPRGRKRAASPPPPASPPPAKKQVVSPQGSPSKTGVARASATADDSAAAAGSGKVDPSCGIPGAQLVPTYDCMLNQTDIKNNNNKFYVIQLVHVGSDYYVFTRWGRVGEVGAIQKAGPMDLDGGMKEFKKKFRDKTANDWDTRKANFVKKSGKYELIEMDASRPITVTSSAPAASKAPVSAKPCKLDAPTKELVEWILNSDTFSTAMADVEIDVKKMPLGAISKGQVQRGFEVLKEIDAAINGGQSHSVLEDLSGKFYTIVPHNFGRNRPTVINSMELLKAKFDMVAMLGDIEIAQTLQKAPTTTTDKHPTDVKYEQLSTDLKLMDKKSKTFQTIKKYVENTSSGRGKDLLEVWEVNRHGEDARFKEHAKLDNRFLLWHGTNVAVVAAILKTGLRIMPTASSGSRVGRGIYLAAEHGKSAAYVRTQNVRGKQHGLMFLCEAPMGKIMEIEKDDWRLTAAPPGFDSIVARGRVDPDPAGNVTIEIEKKKVTVPCGKPVPTGRNSSFHQSEYLVYKESQQRIRYILRFQF